MSEAITISLIVGWFLGFVTYYGVRIGYKTLMQVIDEEQEEQKKDQRAATLKSVKK